MGRARKQEGVRLDGLGGERGVVTDREGLALLAFVAVCSVG